MRDNEIPTREICNLEDPEEMFLWMFVALPGLKGAPMLLPMEYYRGVSKRLYELGARLTEDATLKYQLPRSGDPHWISGMGQWVPLDTPDPVDPTVRTLVQSLSHADRAAFEAELIRQATEDE